MTITLSTSTPASTPTIARATTCARQGDWLAQVVDIPDALADRSWVEIGGSGAVLDTETRGVHTLTGRGRIMRTDDGAILAIADDDLVLTHDQHGWVALACPGLGRAWRLQRQRVVDPFSLVERPALD